MSDPDPTTPDEQVRRLLADARADEPIPDDVAVRLDGVLADLEVESRRTPAPVDLASRRRRFARNALVAAAAVAVLGVGITQIDLTGQGDDAASSGDAGSATAPEATAREEVHSDADGGLNGLAKGRPLRLSSDDFDRQARWLSLHPPLEALADLPLSEGYSADADANAGLDGALAARLRCTDPAWGAGELVPVRYERQPGVLVLRAPTGDTRVVDLYLCGQTSPTRSTTVPAR